jgi:mRNA interferase MazF
MVVLKGEIWWADLPPIRGSEPAKTRPVLILQCDEMNRGPLNTVICAAITSNLNLESGRGNFRIEKADSKLDRTSVVNFSQIVTIDKTFLTECVCTLPKSFIARIEESIKAVFGIR